MYCAISTNQTYFIEKGHSTMRRAMFLPLNFSEGQGSWMAIFRKARFLNGKALYTTRYSKECRENKIRALLKSENTPMIYTMCTIIINYLQLPNTRKGEDTDLLVLQFWFQTHVPTLKYTACTLKYLQRHSIAQC